MTFIEVSSASVVILKEMFDKFLKGTSTVSKNGVPKSIVRVTYRVHLAEFLENLTIDDKFMKKRVRRFIHETCVLKRVEKKKFLGRPNKGISLNIIAK